jgi:N-methylhydantoinase A
LCRELGFRNVICADVGGTTFDVALVEAGEIVEATTGEVARRPVLAPTIDIKSIGAGGGSIARLDHRGNLVVGPQSAGAHPGPACFGLGGVQPTVTDCQLLLGYLDPDNFLGARMRLDRSAAELAVRTALAQPLGMSVEQAAAGALAIVESNMSNAMRAMTVDRGRDPREFALLSYGGGGGLFAAATARDLGVGTVIAPRFAANFSAWGLLLADYVEDAARTRVCDFVAGQVPGIVAALMELLDSTQRVVAGYGFAASAITHALRLDIRYAGQEYALGVPVERSWLQDREQFLQGMRERFVASHRRLYGHGDEEAALEVVTVRCRAVGQVSRQAVEPLGEAQPAKPKGRRRLYVAEQGGFAAAEVYERDTLAAGQTIAGPAIVEEWTTTVIVPAQWTATMDRFGNLLMQPGRSGEAIDGRVPA